MVPSRASNELFSGTRLLYTDLSLDGGGALYEQLARALKSAILGGQLRPGECLPSTRELAATLGLSRNTVLGAYEVLRADQMVTTFDRSRTRVAEGAQPIDTGGRRAITPPQSRYAARLRKVGPSKLVSWKAGLRYDLHYGEPLSDPHIFHAWRRRLAAAALAAGPRYPDTRGFLPLRRAIAGYLARRRGITCSEDDILIVGGTQQAITLAARVVLNEGDVVALEDPRYQYAEQNLRAHGAKIISIRVDANGLVTSALAKRRARMIYVTPSHQFPSGAMLSLKRRIELLQIATRQKSWILEDDYDSEFQYGRRPVAALRSLDVSGRVIYVGTFSKTLFPSLRLGYLVCPPGIRDDLFQAKRLDDLGSPVIEQAALAAFIQSRQFERYLRRSVVELERRRIVLMEGLQREAGERIEIVDSQAGVHLIVWFRDLTYAQVDQLINLGLERGLGLYPLHRHYRKPPKHPGLLLGFAGLSADSLQEACTLFGKCLKELD